MTIDAWILSLGLFAFLGGFIDAAVGGGGLIQLPALLHGLAQYPVATILGTHKLAVWIGNIGAIFQYLKRVHIIWNVLRPIMLTAFIFAFFGAMTVSFIPKKVMLIMVFILLIVMAIYTFIHKNFGTVQQLKIHGKKTLFYAILFGAAIGFYDGVFGPGSGSFLLFLFIKGFGFDFLHASASAKIVNLATFSAALLYFIPSGHILWMTGIGLAICNILGALTGTFLALRLGSGFIRRMFLLLLIALIGRMGVDLFYI